MNSYKMEMISLKGHQRSFPANFLVILVISEETGLSLMKELSFMPVIGHTFILSHSDRKRLEKKASPFSDRVNRLNGSRDKEENSFAAGLGPELKVYKVSCNLEDEYIRVYLKPAAD